MISQRQPRDNVRSNVYRLPRHLRRRADIAIIERCPPTLMAIWMELELGKHGVTYMSFTRYARRLRDRVNLADIAHLTGTRQADLNDKLHAMAARQLLETLLNEDNFEPREFSRLVTALRQMSRTEFQNRKLSEESRLAWARVENERKTIQLNAEKLDLFRRKFLDAPGLKSLPIDDPASAQSSPAPPLKLATAPEETELLAASVPRTEPHSSQ